MTKICTTIEQSKKLIELGIDVNTADMYYQYVLPKSDKIEYNPKVGNPAESLKWYNKGYTHFGKESLTVEEYCVPAWSLVALLNLISTLCVLQFKGDKYHDNPLDAVFEVVVWLKENGKI